MAPLLPSLFLRIAQLGSGPAAQLRDRSPVAFAWKEDHSSKSKRLVVLLDDLASIEYEVANVASGEQLEVPPEYSAGPSDVAYLAITARVDLVVGLVAVLLTPVPNPNSPSGRRPSNTSGAQLLLYDTAARRRHSRGLSLRDSPHSMAPLDDVPQDISLNCSGDLLLACMEREVRIYRIAARESSTIGSSWWGSPKHGKYRQIWPMQTYAQEMIGARFCGMIPNRLLGICQPKPGARAAGSRAAKMDILEGAGDGADNVSIQHVHDAAMGELPGRVTAWSWDVNGETLAIGTAEGIIALHRSSRPDNTKKSVAPEGRMVEAMSWHPLSAVIILILEGGLLAMVDAALQPLLVVADAANSSDTAMTGAVPTVDIAGAFSTQWSRPVIEPFLEGSRTPLYEMAALALPSRGFHDFSVGICQLAVGGLSGGRLRVQELVAQHLSDGEPLRALNLVEASSDQQAQYHSLQLLLDHMLKGQLGGPDTSAIMEVLDETLEVMWTQVEKFPSNLRIAMHAVVRRYVAKLLDVDWVEPAFKVARSCQCAAAMEDVYVAAVLSQDAQLAKAVWDAISSLGEDMEVPKNLPSLGHIEAMERLQVEVAEASLRGSGGCKYNSPSGFAEQIDMTREEALEAGAHLETEGKVKEALSMYRTADREQAATLQTLVDTSKARVVPTPIATYTQQEHELDDVAYPTSPSNPTTQCVE